LIDDIGHLKNIRKDCLCILCVLRHLEMDNQNEHFRHIVFFYFKKGKNAAQTCKKICPIYGEDAMKERVCQKWFARFRCEDFSVKDKPRLSWPNEIDSDKLKAVIDTNPHYTTREIADVLQIEIELRKSSASTSLC